MGEEVKGGRVWKGGEFSVVEGGRVLAGLSSFKGCWIGKEEYDEYGETIVNKRCF